MLQNTNFLVFNNVKLPEIEYKSPVCSNALCVNISVRIWIILSTSFENQVLEPFEPLERFDLRVTLSNCVPR